MWASASESTEFVCVTFPPFPGLRTRMVTFVFSGLDCLASDAARAACAFSAFWSDVWMPVEPDWQHVPPPDDWVCVAS